VNALEGTLVPMQCFTDPGTSRVLCNHELDGDENCATKLLWTRVQGGVTRALEQTTLAELVDFSEHGLQPRARKRAQAPTLHV
jgi:Rrf2 family cysteine metabolism transcriptional repressor